MRPEVFSIFFSVFTLFQRNFGNLLKIFLFLTLNSGCVQRTPVPTPGLDYLKHHPLALDVSHVNFINAYTPSARASFVDHLFPVPLEKLVAQWVESHLRAQGQTKTLVLTLEDARVKEIPIAKPGFYGNHATEKYLATLKVTATLLDAHGHPLQSASIATSVDGIILSGASLDERKRTWTAMGQHALNAFNRALSDHFRTWRVIKDHHPDEMPAPFVHPGLHKRSA